MWHKYKYPIIITGLTIILLGLILGVIAPTAKKIKVSKSEIEQQHQKFKNLLEKGQGLEKNRNNFSMIQSEINILNNVFLLTGQELHFITDLENIAAENKISQDITFVTDKATTQDDIKIIPVGLTLSGELENIISYINQIEALEYYININKVDISTGDNIAARVSPARTIESEDQNNQADTIKVQLAGVTYWK